MPQLKEVNPRAADMKTSFEALRMPVMQEGNKSFQVNASVSNDFGNLSLSVLDPEIDPHSANIFNMIVEFTHDGDLRGLRNNEFRTWYIDDRSRNVYHLLYKVDEGHPDTAIISEVGVRPLNSQDRFSPLTPYEIISLDLPGKGRPYRVRWVDTAYMYLSGSNPDDPSQPVSSHQIEHQLLLPVKPVTKEAEAPSSALSYDLIATGVGVKDAEALSGIIYRLDAHQLAVVYQYIGQQRARLRAAEASEAQEVSDPSADIIQAVRTVFAQEHADKKETAIMEWIAEQKRALQWGKVLHADLSSDDLMRALIAAGKLQPGFRFGSYHAEDKYRFEIEHTLPFLKAFGVLPDDAPDTLQIDQENSELRDLLLGLGWIEKVNESAANISGRVWEGSTKIPGVNLKIAFWNYKSHGSRGYPYASQLEIVLSPKALASLR